MESCDSNFIFPQNIDMTTNIVIKLLCCMKLVVRYIDVDNLWWSKIYIYVIFYAIQSMFENYSIWFQKQIYTFVLKFIIFLLWSIIHQEEFIFCKHTLRYKLSILFYYDLFHSIHFLVLEIRVYFQRSVTNCQTDTFGITVRTGLLNSLSTSIFSQVG